MDLKELEIYSVVDSEKRNLLMGLIESSHKKDVFANKPLMSKSNFDEKMVMDDFCCDMDISFEKKARTCPKCGKKYYESESFCPECLVILKDTEKLKIRDLKSNPKFPLEGKTNFTSFEELLTQENIDLISNFDFTIDDFNEIVHDIKLKSFMNLDNLIKENSIDLDLIDILDKVILYAKSFTKIEYKSYGANLGFFEFDTIYVDDRQRKSLQITTMVHELTHFLIKEILCHVLCRILDTTKNSYIESLITYTLSYSDMNRLIDEYAAHTVEGRFTIFGYQDYSSFVSIQSEVEGENVGVAKMIGNTFAYTVKEILEGFLDWDLREEIKDQFLKDTIEKPDYSQLRFESCKKLTDSGFLKAIWMILFDGLVNADIELLVQYEKKFERIDG